MLLWEPVAPYHWIAAGVAGFAVLAFCAGLLLARRANRHANTGGWRQMAILGLTALAALAFAIAAWNPILSDRPATDEVHLVVVLDLSGSVQRAAGGWKTIHTESRQFLASALEAVPEALRSTGNGSIITFGRSVLVLPTERLTDLLNRYSQLGSSHFPLADGSDLAGALNTAGQTLAQSGQRAAILLISDGNATTPGALEAADGLARQGIPIFVYPVTSQQPALAIAAAYLPRRVNVEEDAYLRGVIANHRPNAVDAALSLAQIGGQQAIEDAAVPEWQIEQQWPLPPNGKGVIRQRMEFSGLGVQFVDLNLTSIDEADPAEHHRRFFTHVTKPLQILAIGDNGWVSLLPAEAAIVTQIGPEEVTDQLMAEADAMVISDVYDNQFAPGVLAKMASAVQERGAGLMVINGEHRGRSEEEETVLMSYIDTPIEPLLPVSSRPRPFTPEPPPRNIVIIIDTSGSMYGWRLEKSKEIMRHVIETFLRPEDHFDLISFDSGARHLVRNRAMSADGKAEALAVINSLQPGGGSNLDAAFEKLNDLQLSNCGLLLITDGEVLPVTHRPECRTAIFAVDKSESTIPQVLRDINDAFPVDERFSPQNITIPYFEPEPRDKFFEPGNYTALSAMRFATLPFPELPLAGNAVSYILENAELVAVRPKLTDPVLAYRDAGVGYVGAFTTAIPDGWRGNVAAERAVEAWINRLVPYVARNRYDFVITDRGEAMDIEISLLDEDRIPAVAELIALLEMPGGATVPLLLRAVDGSPATFRGQMRPPRGDGTVAATLILREAGLEALSRPQRVPFLVPPRRSPTPPFSQEDDSYGQNVPLLQKIAEVSGGRYDPVPRTPFFRERAANLNKVLLWPWLVAVGALFYLTAIALRRLAPEGG